ncbi:uncharacterized protein LOC116192377 isoform X2 [Punica granatum]|uniref:Uncharacterized protein LOC116192377 isoform X2 n=1 Tax=Punica granatum TaxID=22663 RepID=A0A6P8C017_PUNGR|nr:uncharacterized protein LOC116192377 isoform X2 [Punica granatum]
MKAMLLRTGSVAAQSPVVPTSAVALSRQESLTGVFSGGRTAAGGSPRITLHLEVNRRTGGIRRSLSDTDVVKSVGRLASARSMSFPSMVPEDMRVDPGDESTCLTLERNFDEMWTKSGTLGDELGFFGGGFEKGSNSGGNDGDRGSGGGFGGRRDGMGEYYREMLKSNPGDPLLLRNYGKYLHEVERDYERAEECYGRAILASPGDGEVLSLYGKLIWDSQRDERRARSYFDQAVQASPEDW